MTKFSVKLELIRKRKGKKTVMRTEHHIHPDVGAIIKHVAGYIKTYDIEAETEENSDDVKTLGSSEITQITEDGERTIIGRVKFDGTLVLYNPVSDNCIYCYVHVGKTYANDGGSCTDTDTWPALRHAPSCRRIGP